MDAKSVYGNIERMIFLGKMEGQVAIVTGGGQGLGQALCLRLHDEGAKVVVADINPDAARDTANQLRDSLAIKVDVADYSHVRIWSKKPWPSMAELTCWSVTQQF